MRGSVCLLLLSAVALLLPKGAVGAEGASSSSPTARICLVVPRELPEVLEEAQHRIIAELRAVGFLVDLANPVIDPDAETLQPPEVCDGAAGTLIVSPVGPTLTIVAAAPDEDPLLQKMDLISPRTTAEVVAIRAVEGLRAALIQAMRNAEASPESSPAAVRDFTHLGTTEPTPVEPPPVEPQSTEPPPELAAETATARRRKKKNKSQPVPFPLFASLGPNLSSDGGRVGGGLELLFAWRPGFVSVGALLDASLVPGEMSLPGGSVALRQYSLLARVAVELPCPPKFICELAANFGIRQIAIEASPNDTTTLSQSGNHTSALLAGDVLAGYFFAKHVGLGGRFTAGGLLDAPVLSASGVSERWGRPSLSGAILALGRF